MKNSKDRAIEKEKTGLCYSSVHRYKKQYDEFISLARSENTLPKQKEVKCGRPKRGKILCLFSVNDFLKNMCQIEHTRHRSVDNFLVNLIAG